MLSLLFVTLLLLPPLLLVLSTAPMTEAQTDPPPFGEGSWIITTPTLLKDTYVRINGSIVINAGASLTLENTTLLLRLLYEFQYRITVLPGAGFYIYNGSYLGAFDWAYCVYYHPGSFGQIKNSTIANHDGLVIGTRSTITIEDSDISAGYYGIVMWGGSTVVRNVTIHQNNVGIWTLNGDIWAIGSSFDGDGTSLELSPICGGIGQSRLALWAPPWDTPIGNICAGPRNGYFLGNSIARSIFKALFVYASTVELSNNTIEESAGYGLSVYTGIMKIENNIFRNLSKGIDIEPKESSASQITMRNNDFLDCYNYGIWYTDFAGLTGTWTIDRPTHINSLVSTRTPLSVIAGGHLHIFNTTLGMLSFTANPLGVSVAEGGEALFENIRYEPVGVNGDEIYLQVLDKGKLTVRNSTLNKVGYAWGIKGETGGVFSEGTTLIEGSSIDSGMYGVIAGGGRTLVKNTTLDHTSYALQTNGGHMDVVDTSLGTTSVRDVIVENGQADLYNLSFNKAKYTVGPNGILNVYWRCDLATMWQNGEPLGNVTYNISESSGEFVRSGISSPDGLSQEFFLREFQDVGGVLSVKTPHKVIGGKADMDLWNTTTIDVQNSKRLMFYLRDNITPSINVTYPGLIVYQMNNTLNVNGTARDDQSGLDRVEWSYDLDLWYPATGLLNWNFTVILPYGAKLIYIRAVDKAGNEKLLTMVATIDKDAPYLLLLSPDDGLITPLRTVLVEGYAEMGSTVTAQGVSVVSVDGSFRMSVPLREGLNDLVVTATAPSGLKNSTTVRVTRDTEAPPIIILNPPQDYITNNPRDKVLTIKGLTEPGAKFTANGKAINLNPDGNFTITFDLKEGLNVMNFVSVDDVGNQNTSILRITFDVQAPSLNVYAPADDLYTNRTTVHVSGLTEPLLNVTVTAGNLTSSVEANREGRFELDVGLIEGRNNLTVIVRDLAGNTDLVSLQVTRDTTPPKITLSSIIDNMVVTEARIFLEGQTEPGAKVKVNGELVDPGYTGHFSKWVDLPSSNNPIVVEAIDKAGNRNILTTHVQRKPTVGPGGHDVQAGPDYFPWVALIVLIILIVQLALYIRYSLNKAKKKIGDGAVKSSTGARRGPSTPTVRQGPATPASGGRVSARRPATRPKPGSDQSQGPEEPEFEFEPGDVGTNRQGGGRR